MSIELQIIYLARHGETAWSLSGQHTGRTDLPLTSNGERNGELLGTRLKGLNVARVLTSPLMRARRTCELAGFGGQAQVDPDLTEWDYGKYEGLRSVEIRRERPDWDLFRDGCPGGETPDEIAARAERVVERLRSGGGNVLLFSSGHFLRVLAGRWTRMPLDGGRFLMLGTASLSVLGYENDVARPVIRLWNDTRHLEGSG